MDVTKNWGYCFSPLDSKAYVRLVNGRLQTATVADSHHAGWLTSNMLLLQHTDLGSMFSLYRTIKTAAFCNHEISDVSTVLGIPEEARKKNTSSEEFSTNIGDEKTSQNED